MKNKAIVSIGSNQDRTKNVKRVIELLTKTFSSIRFTTPQLTEAIDLPEDTKPFLNLLALIETDMELDALNVLLKRIETKLGRDRDDEDDEGEVPMDLDIIEWNDEVIKPQDMIRPYVVAGLDELDEL